VSVLERVGDGRNVSALGRMGERGGVSWNGLNFPSADRSD
jgi:hypothetical protein